MCCYMSPKGALRVWCVIRLKQQLTRYGQVPQGTQCCVLYRHVAFLHVTIQQLQKLLHNTSVHHVDAVPIYTQIQMQSEDKCSLRFNSNCHVTISHG